MGISFKVDCAYSQVSAVPDVSDKSSHVIESFFPSLSAYPSPSVSFHPDSPEVFFCLFRIIGRVLSLHHFPAEKLLRKSSYCRNAAILHDHVTEAVFIDSHLCGFPYILILHQFRFHIKPDRKAAACCNRTDLIIRDFRQIRHNCHTEVRKFLWISPVCRAAVSALPSEKDFHDHIIQSLPLRPSSFSFLHQL